MLSGHRSLILLPVVFGMLFPTAGLTRSVSPRILALARDELQVYEQKGDKLVELGAQDLRPYLARTDYGRNCGLITTPTSIIVVAPGALVLFDRSFLNPQVWRPDEGQEIGAAAAFGEHLLVAVNGELWVLDDRLERVGKVKLPTGSRPKDAHDILVDGKRAYLLDNISFPIFVFIVDLSTVNAPKVVGQLQMEDVYPHLKAQWLSSRADRWVIIQSAGGRGGSRETALFLSRRPPLRVLAGQVISRRVWPDMRRFRASPPRAKAKPASEKNNLEIHAVTRGSPVYAVVGQGESTSLARLTTSRTRIGARRLARLDETALRLAPKRAQRLVKQAGGGQWRVARRGKFLAVNGHAALFLVRLVGDKARMVTRSSLLAKSDSGTRTVAFWSLALF